MRTIFGVCSLTESRPDRDAFFRMERATKRTGAKRCSTTLSSRFSLRPWRRALLGCCEDSTARQVRADGLGGAPGTELLLAGNCRLDRDILGQFRALPFRSIQATEFYLENTPKTHGYTCRGQATK